MKVNIGDDDKPKEEPKKHTPEVRMGGMYCAQCGKILGSQEQDKPCPGRPKEVKHTKINDHNRKFEELYDVSNQLYALIFPILSKYETPGYNAHSRAQSITMETAEKMGAWIWQQKESPVKE